MANAEYTKADLVEYIYRRSNATKKALTDATVEQLEGVITRWDKWSDFKKQLPRIVEYRKLNNNLNAMFRALKGKK